MKSKSVEEGRQTLRVECDDRPSASRHVSRTSKMKGNGLTSMMQRIASVKTNHVANMKTTKRVLKMPASEALVGNEPSSVML
jgi:hypothetical protein